MSGQETKVFQPESQQDYHQQYSTSSGLEDNIKALQNQLPYGSSQGMSAQTCHLLQANVSPSFPPISADTKPQQHTSISLSPARGSGTEREQIAKIMLASHTRQGHAMDGTFILSQGQLKSSEQPSFGSAGSKAEFQSSTTLGVHCPFWKVWWQELLCIIISITSLIVIVVVLVYYDGQTLPDWPFEITLNTFLAFFTTLAKAAFMLPVSIALSQSKFTWLHEAAIPGAAQALGHQFGAILMVVSILSSPVTQLAVNYRQRNDTALDEEASIITIDKINISHRKLLKLADLAAFKATIPESGNFEEPAPPQRASCSTGNCDFGPYQSLGVCVDIANITSKLRTESKSNLTSELLEDGGGRLGPGQKTWNVSLSSEYGVLHQNPLVVKGGELMGTDTFGFSNNTRLLETKIASFFFIYTSPTPPNKTTQDLRKYLNDETSMAPLVESFGYEALEVVFHMCVQKFQTKVHMGVEKTHMIDALSQIDDKSKGIILGPNCQPLVDRLDACEPVKDPGDLVAHLNPPSPGTRKFSAPYKSMWHIGAGFSYFLSGEAEIRYVAEGRAFIWSDGFSRPVFENILYNNKNMFNSTRRAAQLNNFFQDIATSLSSTSRTAHHQDKRPGVFVIKGTPLKEVTYVHITWGWISFLAVEIAAAVLFLVIAITAQSTVSRERGPENVYIPADAKDSALATLVVLSKDCREALGDGLQPAGVLQKTS
ncbi:hypothetical protein CPAR01_13982 [Colletotrichum paranaense]|uniref:Uncharacterized protein n=1 Tax=Colletotrichum paranaense TaxID=1914294 RepID=A0ABQ9S3B3_9PEZI|nr:uncharacterized protein CPAR01_13982 [Colletotrichum paranaense]KAK1523129.1 hypothetical protein CPAR01_13982 [Colletotrichum paranaense]